MLFTFFLALLTGKTKVNASARTTVNSVCHNTENRTNGNINELEELRTQKVKDDAVKLIQLVENTSSFETMRTNQDKEHFNTFIELCLIHSTTAVRWRYKCYCTPISKIFTICDEALAMLMLENNVADLKRINSEKRKLTRKESTPKYTRVNKDTGNKFQGWHKDGIKRFNELYKVVKEQREKEESKELEIELRNKFARLGNNDNNQGEGRQMQQGSDNDNSDNEIEEDVFAIDAFADNSEMPSLGNNRNEVPV